MLENPEPHTPVEFFVVRQVVSCVVNHHHIWVCAEKDCGCDTQKAVKPEPPLPLNHIIFLSSMALRAL